MKSAINGLCMTLFALIGAPLLGFQQGAKPEGISLLVRSGDDPAMLTTLLVFALPRSGVLPRVIALEPGPLDLARGLRILPNEVVPRLSLPQLLVLPGQADLTLGFTILAVVRACLLAGGQVWVVGDALPHDLTELDLEPGMHIARLEQQDLQQHLEHWALSLASPAELLFQQLMPFFFKMTRSKVLR